MVTGLDDEHSAVVPDLYSPPDWRNTGLHLPHFAKELIAGGTAGGLGKTVVAPLERVKILFQTGRLPRQSVYEMLQYIYRHEGFSGFYKGNGASVLRIIPYAAIHFASFERYRAALVSLQHLDPLDPSEQPSPIADLFAGAAAGATAVILTYPLDLVRTRLAYITDQPGSSSSNSSTSLSSRGTVSSGSASASAAARSTSAPVCSSIVADSSRKANARSDSHMGGSSSQTSSGPQQPQPQYPQQQQQQQARRVLPERGRIRYMVGGILQRDGVAGLYRGIGPTVVGILPYAGLKFYVYQSCKQHWRKATGQDPGQRLPVAIMLTCGALSGLVAQTATYPLDVVRRRMQVQSLQQNDGTAHLRSTWHGLRVIAAQGGLRGMFTGLSINYMKVVPATAIGFTLYDTLKQLLGLRASI